MKHLKKQYHHLNGKLNRFREKLEGPEIQDARVLLHKEIANTITHGIGLLFFLIAIPVMLTRYFQQDRFIYTATAMIFGLGLAMVYLSSTLYHGIQHASAKRILQIIDHVSIFLLIGGSYTPIVYHFLPLETAIPFLTVLWVIIAGGIVYKIFFTGRYRILSTLLYLVLGYLSLFVIRPISANMPSGSFNLLVLGGVLYTVGTIFYLWKAPKYNHAVWHVFVLGGSISHYFVVFNIV
ncbi:MAG: hemolysin III family protein [Chitinophagales bacterium]